MWSLRGGGAVSEVCASPCLLDWLRLATAMLTPLSIVGLGILAKIHADGLERRRTLFEVGARWRIEVFSGAAEST